MFPYHSLVALCLAPLSAGAVFNRRGGSADATAPFANHTFKASPSAPAPLSTDHGPTPGVLHLQVDHSSVSNDAQPSTISSQYAVSHSEAVGSFISQSSTTLFFEDAIAASTYDSPHASFTRSSDPSLVETPASHYANATTVIPSYTNITSSQRSSNATCTINIPDASVDYWYPPTYSHLLGTMTTSALNFSNSKSYTLVPHTKTFDVASALVTDYVCTSSYSYIAEWDWTVTYCVDYTGSPVAAATSLAYRSAAAPWPTDGLIPVSDARFYDLYSDGMPSATAEVTMMPNVTYTETSSTPWVYFTAYEVETGNKTQTVRLRSPQAYPYWLKGVDRAATATGGLPDGFLDQIPESACDPGRLQATVTVWIVVDLYYQNLPNNDPWFIHFESSADGFEEETVGVLGTVREQPLTVPDWPVATGIQPNIQQTGRSATTGNNDNMFNFGGDASQIEDFTPAPTRVIVGTIGTNPVVIGPSSQVIIGTQTLRPGGPPITVGNGIPVSLAPSGTAIVISGTTSQLPHVLNPAPGPVIGPPLLTIGSSTLTPNAATQFLVAPGQTLTPGGEATLDGTVVSLAPSASFVVIGGSTQIFPTAVPNLIPVSTGPPQIVVAGSTIIAEPTGDGSGNFATIPTFLVSGQTLAPGGSAITFSGTTLSLAESGTVVVVNGVESHVARPVVAITSKPSLTIGGNVLSARPGSGNTFVIAGQTLAPGGPAITISGTTVSIDSSASFVVVNGMTSAISDAAAQITPPPLTIGNAVFTALPGTGTAYVISSMLLTPGGSIVVAGITISLSPEATALVIDGQTSMITTPPPTTTNPPLLTIGSRTYTALEGGGTTFMIDGQTLTPGGTITADGTTIILSKDATELIYGISGRSTTTALFPATITRSQSVTNTADPRAGASESNRQPAATNTSGGSAILLHASCAWIFTIVFLSASILV